MILHEIGEKFELKNASICGEIVGVNPPGQMGLTTPSYRMMIDGHALTLSSEMLEILFTKYVFSEAKTSGKAKTKNKN